ncbi:hypothetical protein RIF23_04530 [Lipingzhangella sp. LS1_29]|uniref:Uncharacterized protein n=1 Tax=Lipingzhangella rawalii TaxID=2055835 RepID=A0ABU2H2N3_9ACTN|nr:hypothetical protein [Lipingzhangella rawalii]MDS1269562.1 hypothetical protein [Lipingzhangella rawalii]
MSFLVTVLLFGIVGAVMLCALLGLALPRLARSGSRTRILFGAAPLAVLLLVATSAAVGVLSAADAGFGTAFLAAFTVLALCYAASSLLVPLLARNSAQANTDGGSRAGQLGAVLTAPVTVLGAGLGCAALAGATAGVALLIT